MDKQAEAMGSTRDDFAQVIAFQAAMILPMQLEPEEVALVKDNLQGLLMSDSKPFSIRITLDADWREKLNALADSGNYGAFKASEIIDITAIE